MGCFIRLILFFFISKFANIPVSGNIIARISANITSYRTKGRSVNLYLNHQMFVHFCTFCKLNTSSERIVGMSLRMFYERTYCTNSMKLGIGKFQTKIHPANLIVVGRHLSMKYLFVRGKILNFVKFIRKRYIAQKCNTSI